MSKHRSQYQCRDCGYLSNQWLGQCNDCGQWNSLDEVIAQRSGAKVKAARGGGYAGATHANVIPLSKIKKEVRARESSQSAEFDRALGGGLVDGAVILLGGDPGIGKSTLLLQATAALSQQRKTLYVTGEESLEQVALRADRLGVPTDKLDMLAETRLESILQLTEKTKPRVLVIDSIQTLFSEDVSSAPGSVSQVRECAGQLVQYAKHTQTTIFLVGHVTKEGALAGPRVLEHMVDTVLYFEGGQDSRFRMLRAVKNRFGAVNELGVFAMTEKGLKDVSNPSKILISQRGAPVPGSIVTVCWEGTRPLLAEVQALVDDSQMEQPRRVAIGVDAQRLTLVLAVLSRHAGVPIGKKDVFVNVVGGLKLSETALDVALALAILSSLKDVALSGEMTAFGELGLAGEIRPVAFGPERIRESVKQGYGKIIAPEKNCVKKPSSDSQLKSVAHVKDLLDFF